MKRISPKHSQSYWQQRKTHNFFFWGGGTTLYITFEDGCKLPASERSGAAELAQSEFHVEERDSDEDEHYGVRNEERAAAVTIAQVRKPPHVTQTHGIPARRRYIYIYTP